jgi:hypothetical protein
MISCRLPGCMLVCLLMTAVSSPARGADAITATIRATFKITNKDSTAAGFLIARPDRSDPGKQDVILVTAGHVFERMSGDQCRVVLREPRPDGTWQRKELPLEVRDEGRPLWFRHPEADVAALPVELPPTVAAAALPLGCVAGESAIESGKLKSGDEVWIPCYPAQLESNGAGFAVLRRGAVASFPLAPVRAYKTFLVDYSTFGGDSGAPVMVRQTAVPDGPRGAEDRPLIVGLVVGQHRQTDKVKLPYEERTTHHPLGLAIVVQAEFIRQTIERVGK